MCAFLKKGSGKVCNPQNLAVKLILAYYRLHQCMIYVLYSRSPYKCPNQQRMCTL